MFVYFSSTTLELCEHTAPSDDDSQFIVMKDNHQDSIYGLPGKNPSEQFINDQDHLGQSSGGVKVEDSTVVVPYKSPNGDIFWLWTNWPGLNLIQRLPGWSQFQQQASTLTSSYSGPVQTVVQQIGLGTFVDPSIENPFKELLDPVKNPALGRLPSLVDIPLIILYGRGNNSSK